MYHFLLDISGFERKSEFPFRLSQVFYCRSLCLPGGKQPAKRNCFEFSLRLESKSSICQDIINDQRVCVPFPNAAWKMPMQGYTFGDNEPRDTIALIYPPESVELFRKIGLIPKESCRPYIVSGAIKLLVGKFYKLLNSIYSPGVPDQMDWLGFCLIKEVLLAGENRSGKQSMAILMQNISIWLKIHSSEEQNLREVARQNGMSHAKFYSEWKKAFGITPLQYIINARLESAANLLRQTNLSIEQIVKTVNFSGTYAFHRKFAKEYAMTPGEYRAAHAPKD